VIVGAGDSACEEVHFLSKLCKKVNMLVRKREFRASKIMAERVRKTPNIEILYNTETLVVMDDDVGVTGARVINSIRKKSLYLAQDFLSLLDNNLIQQFLETLLI
jgi:thioredoxin reductase (NADPH)